MPRRAARRKPPATLPKRPAKRRDSEPVRYWEVSQRPLQCLAFLAPMIAAYELGMIWLHGSALQQQRPFLAAQQILQWFFSLFGATGYYLPGAALIAVLLFWHLASQHPWKVEGWPLGGMAGESVLLAIPLLLLNDWIPGLAARSAVAQGGTVGSAVLLQAANGTGSRLDDLLLSVGAGLYEELVFRLMIISLLSFVISDVGRARQSIGVACAVIVSSLLFAAHHYAPIGAEEFTSGGFAFRSAAGGYLAGVYVLRGFGLAVGCHVVYDVMAFLI
ncbi:MAG: CPBP family intramembrane metalloprotease [Planctomycetia bacterium]|nr:MAG: CPBP family intramembrane metalloprotease [Planctomycetia bacterium]